MPAGGRITAADGVSLHGGWIVPVAHGRRLFELAAPAAAFHVIEGAGHNDTYLVGGEPYATAWTAFLRRG